MRRKKTYVVVGAGQAGGQGVQTLLGDSADCRIVLVGAERFVPHERPMLSKDLLLGTEPFESTFMKPESFYVERGVELRLGTLVRGIDRASNRVVLDHEAISYDKLLLATGARARRLEVPGADLAGVHYLRTIDDALALRANLRSSASVVVLGGGVIGWEVAAAARAVGCDVVL